MGHSLVGQCKLTTSLAPSHLSLLMDLNFKNHKKKLRGLDVVWCLLIVPFLPWPLPESQAMVMLSKDVTQSLGL